MIYIIFIGMMLFNIFVLYLFFNLTLAVWKPERAKARYLNVIKSPGGQLVYPLIKWLSPIQVILMPIAIINGIVNFVTTINT